MCEQSEINYLDGEVVWVKLGSCWWPGEVVALDKLPPDVLPSFRKPPIAIVKFFQEDSYEYVKNNNSIFKYDCSRKKEFISKGLYMYRTKPGNNMHKFPEDVIRAETATGGDIEILTRKEFQEEKKESYAGLFGDPVKRTPTSIKKGRGRPSRSTVSSTNTTPVRKSMREKSDYKVHILVQSSKSTNQTETISTPSTSRAHSEVPEDKTEKQEETESKKSVSSFSTPSSSGSGLFSCHACNFTTTRLNVMILHNKTHSVTYMPYTPSPVKKSSSVQGTPKSIPKIAKTPKPRRIRKDKEESTPKKSKALKRTSEDTLDDLDAKKTKTDEEIKSSLLADWDDGEEDEESTDLSSSIALAPSPEVATAAESSAVATIAELPSAQVPGEVPTSPGKKSDDASVGDKPESSSDSKYEFCEDEDWPLEKDGGRKIPRVKNASKRKEDSKSIDEDDMAKEVAELLNKTALPELPSVPEPLKIEENFPEPSIIKSPDKVAGKDNTVIKTLVKELPSTKAIFKTKTFFRSRHSRSQDAIGKYVAEQLNAAERMDLSECELNGSDNVSSPEARDSPPVEQVKVARLAPKIQLKKMKAEAAQIREKEKQLEKSDQPSSPKKSNDKTSLTIVDQTESCSDKPLLQWDVLYPTQEIKPINKESFLNKPFKIININTNDNLDSISEKSNEVKHLNIDTFNDKKEVITCEPCESFMSESTASAVDALLSVSREADRVTKVISDDPPEDLFEDDIKDTLNTSNENGLNEKKEDCGLTYLVEDVQREPIELNGDMNDDKLQLNVETQNVNDVPQSCQQIVVDEIPIEEVVPVKVLETEEKEVVVEENIVAECISENVPSESDLQIAEALINLPSTAVIAPMEIKNILPMSPSFVSEEILEETVCTTGNVDEDCDTNCSEVKKLDTAEEPSTLPIQTDDDVALPLDPRFETEEEKCENLNAAQSLVQMSESIDHKIKLAESCLVTEKNIVAGKDKTIIKTFKPKKMEEDSIKSSSLVSNKESLISTDKNSTNGINTQFDSSTSKLLKILEEPPAPPRSQTSKVVTKQMIVTGSEKILNFDVSSSPIKPKAQSPPQKIIIRRAAPTKNVINLNEVTAPEKIILSRSNKASSDSVQTYTIQSSPDANSDANTIIIQPKIRKITKTPPKQLQKNIKEPVTNASAVIDVGKMETITDDAMFDINSMPIVLSDEILTPENIDKMPIVMSDGNIITNPVVTTIVTTTPSKFVKTKQITHTEKIAISPLPCKPEVKQKPLIMNQVAEVNKVTTPNILSKSSKMRSAKPMLVIDKTGKQKFVMTKTDTAIKEIKQAPTKIQPVPQTAGKSEKFIILPSPAPSRPTRTQKIVIDPQTGKAHVLVSKGPDLPVSGHENKPVAAKLIPSQGDASCPGNTVMIITNAQGAQSRIVLTPEHEKILFPNKQQPNVSQLKTIVQSPRMTNSTAVLKTVMTTSAPIRAPAKIVPKQKSAIITSKGQLIVGGRIATSVQNIAPMPEVRQTTTEVRTMPKRIIASEPKKLVQTIQKNSSEPLIFLQQKSGTVMQLTAAQFEHLQKTGKIVQKPPVQESKKIILQKSITIPAKDTTMITPKHTKKVRKTMIDSPAPAKKVKHEMPVPTIISSTLQSPGHTILAPAASFLSITSAPGTALSLGTAPVPSLAPLSHSVPPAQTSAYAELDNLEELLPSTAIVRQQEPPPPVQEEIIPPQEQPMDHPAEAALTDGQLVAVPGENCGGLPGTFYLCFEDSGTLTPIDNRPLVLENNQLVPMVEQPAPERRDILEAALANSDVFQAETPYREPAPMPHAGVVSETSTTLHQPIMTPVEVPSNVESEPAVLQHSIEEGLAVIGVTPGIVPSSLELPITVTDPRIALLGTDAVGKSMPLLTDEAADASSAGSPASLEDTQWARRLLTPTSDVSDASAELPLQPPLRLSMPDLSRPV